MSETPFSDAPAVEAIALGLISSHHSHLDDPEVRIVYLFTDKETKKNGKSVWGQCRRISSLSAFLAGQDEDESRGDAFFVITIWREQWDCMTTAEQEALVDHELCHAWAEWVERKNDEGQITRTLKLSIRPHDVEEFGCIIDRHGLWNRDVRRFSRSVDAKREQLTLPFSTVPGVSAAFSDAEQEASHA